MVLTYDLTFHFVCGPGGGFRDAEQIVDFCWRARFFSAARTKPRNSGFFRTKSFRVASGAHSACNSKSVFISFSLSSPITCPSILRAGRVESFPFVAPPQKAPGYRANSSCWRTSLDRGDQKFRIFFGPNRSKSLAMEIAHAMQTEPLAMKIGYAFQFVLFCANGANVRFGFFVCGPHLSLSLCVCFGGFFRGPDLSRALEVFFCVSFHFVCGPGGGFPICCTPAGGLGTQSK